MLQGITIGKEGLKRDAYDDISIEAVAYSIYRFGRHHEISMMRVSDFYKESEEHGVYKEFRTSKMDFLKKLRALSSDANRVLIAELNMGLDSITLREDLNPIDVLKQLVL